MTEAGGEGTSKPPTEVANASSPPAELQSAVRKLADKKPETLLDVMRLEMSSIGNPLHHKMTETHISQVIELAAKHDEREYNLHKASQENELAENKSNRGYFFAAFLVLVHLWRVSFTFIGTKPTCSYRFSRGWVV